jgi:hypothetical protein
VWFVVVLGALLVLALARAGWMDAKAGRAGKRWVPVKQRGLRRTRFELVDRGEHEVRMRERALEEAAADRRLRDRERGYLMLRLPRRLRPKR